jgi:hypothetical protein
MDDNYKEITDAWSEIRYAHIYILRDIFLIIQLLVGLKLVR